MGLNDAINADRVHIGFLGMRNAGKSSLLNAITEQEISVVSDIAGTTTDSVKKAMELLPIGPVMLIDTPGIDDVGELGSKRVAVTKKVLNRIDIAVLVIDAVKGISGMDKELISLFEEKNIPYIIVYNKCDMLEEIPVNSSNDNSIYVSATSKLHVEDLKKLIATSFVKKDDKRLVADLVNKGDYIVLVVPIDSAAPKGRIILPQQQAIRDILDSEAVSIVVKETELERTLNNIGVKPSLVITDSQVFEQVNKIVPRDIPLTSFSILMARYKGFLDIAVNGARALDNIKDGDTILISEGCTHHRQCNDIGTVKLPAFIKKYTGCDVSFEFSSGSRFADKLDNYSLIVHCGGCMISEREVNYRMKCAGDEGVPVTNYGIAIAYMKGILDRSIEMLNG